MRRFMNILLALVALAACERRPLSDIEYKTRIDVKVNIEAIANVTCDVYNEKVTLPPIEPVAMHVIFFDKETEEVAAESFLSEVSYTEDGSRVLGGNISIMPGDYKMLVYDFGTETTIVENYYDWNECRAYTEEISPALKKSFASKMGKDLDDTNIIFEPDHLVVASKETERIPYHNKVHVIETDATSIIDSYYLQIKVDGLEHVSSAQAILSGMVSSNLISSNTRITEPQATIWFDLEKSDDKGVPVICTVFNTFGRIEDSFNELKVTFDIKTHDGRIVQEVFDISDLFHTPECIEHNWLLLEETIVVDPPPVAGGWSPEVSDWEEEYREITI